MFNVHMETSGSESNSDDGTIQRMSISENVHAWTRWEGDRFLITIQAKLFDEKQLRIKTTDDNKITIEAELSKGTEDAPGGRMEESLFYSLDMPKDVDKKTIRWSNPREGILLIEALRKK